MDDETWEFWVANGRFKFSPPFLLSRRTEFQIISFMPSFVWALYFCSRPDLIAESDHPTLTFVFIHPLNSVFKFAYTFWNTWLVQLLVRLTKTCHGSIQNEEQFFGVAFTSFYSCRCQWIPGSTLAECWGDFEVQGDYPSWFEPGSKGLFCGTGSLSGGSIGISLPDISIYWYRNGNQRQMIIMGDQYGDLTTKHRVKTTLLVSSYLRRIWTASQLFPKCTRVSETTWRTSSFCVKLMRLDSRDLLPSKEYETELGSVTCIMSVAPPTHT